MNLDPNFSNLDTPPLQVAQNLGNGLTQLCRRSGGRNAKQYQGSALFDRAGACAARVLCQRTERFGDGRANPLMLRKARQQRAGLGIVQCVGERAGWHGGRFVTVRRSDANVAGRSQRKSVL